MAKVCVVKVMVFSGVIYGCESWTIKKAECWRTDAFKLWFWRRVLRVPLTARRSNQLILRQINPEYLSKDWSWSWNSSTLVTWCKELTHWERHWCWERWRAGGEEDDRGWGGWIASLTQGTWIWANSRRQWRTAQPGVLPESRMRLCNWKTATTNNTWWFWICCLYLYWTTGVWLNITCGKKEVLSQYSTCLCCEQSYYREHIATNYDETIFVEMGKYKYVG